MSREEAGAGSGGGGGWMSSERGTGVLGGGWKAGSVMAGFTFIAERIISSRRCRWVGVVMGGQDKDEAG